MHRRCIVVLLACCLLPVVGGCHRNSTEVAPAEPPAIPVSHPVSREVTDYVDFTGQTDAVQSLNVTARVTGYLVKLPFKEGSEVRGDDRLRGAVRVVGLLTAPLGPGPLLAAACLFPGQFQDGDLLFEIDPRPYQAQLDQAQGQVYLNQAQLRLAIANYARAKDVAKTPGAISPQDLDTYKAQQEQADAAVKAAEASLEVFKLNLSFCRVTSPIDGRISRYYLTLGNLVNQDQTLLTTVVSQDPMYGYFDVDEPTVLRVRRAVNEGKIKRPQSGLFQVLMGLQGEDGFPHRGSVDFVNNQVNPTTGSLSFRGVFANPLPSGGVRLLSPGMFVRIRLPIGQAHPALLVIDRAIGSDQGLKYVYVLDAENKAQYRRITPGPLQDDGLRVVEGLHADDWVVTGGLQQVRPRMQIRPDKEPMPSLAPQPAGDQKSEVRSQRSEIRGQRSEVRDQRSEIRGQTNGIAMT
jgi:multidrug efflux system membrane fusion protein